MTRRSPLGRDKQAQQLVHDGLMAGWTNERIYQEVKSLGISRSAVGRYVQQFRTECLMLAQYEDRLGAAQIAHSAQSPDDVETESERQEISRLTADAIDVLRLVQDRSTDAKEAFVRANPADTYQARRSLGLSKHTVDIIRRQILGCDV